jgi:hypothetical protein
MLGLLGSHSQPDWALSRGFPGGSFCSWHLLWPSMPTWRMCPVSGSLPSVPLTKLRFWPGYHSTKQGRLLFSRLGSHYLYLRYRHSGSQGVGFDVSVLQPRRDSLDFHSKLTGACQVPVAHTCSPSQLGQIVRETLSQKNPPQKRAGGVAQGIATEFKPQVPPKKKK